MSARPPARHPYLAEPTDAQLAQAQRIAQRTGKTVAQVLSLAIGRGTSAQFAELLRSPVSRH